MKLTEAEIQSARARGLHITEKCGYCGKILNQTMRYTVAGKPEIFCTAACRDKALLGAKGVERVTNNTRCFRCHQYKAAGSLYCARCQAHADPHGKEVGATESPCEVCGEPVPVLRRANGSTACSQRCKEAAKKRNQRNRAALAAA